MPTLDDAIAALKPIVTEAKNVELIRSPALAHALQLLEGLRWRPIETAPAEGYFMAWNNAWDEPLKVHRWNGHGRWNVCHGHTGKLWQATHWLPLPPQPEGRP